MGKVKILKDGSLNNLKIVTYYFDDGTVSKIEVDENTFSLIEESYRKEENYERKCRYWIKIRLDESEYEGDWFKDENTPSRNYDIKIERNEVNKFIDTLTDIEKRRLQYRIDDPHISLREIARIEGKSSTSVWRTFNYMRRKLKEFKKLIYK